MQTPTNQPSDSLKGRKDSLNHMPYIRIPSNSLNSAPVSQPSSASKHFINASQTASNFYIPSNYNSQSNENRQSQTNSFQMGQIRNRLKTSQHKVALNVSVNTLPKQSQSFSLHPPGSPNMTNSQSILTRKQTTVIQTMSSTAVNFSKGNNSKHKSSASCIPVLSSASSSAHKMNQGSQKSRIFDEINNDIIDDSRRTSFGNVQKEDSLLKMCQIVSNKRNTISDILKKHQSDIKSKLYIEATNLQNNQDDNKLFDFHNANLLLVMLSTFQEELETKYILLPSVESSVLQKLLEIEKVIFKYLQNTIDTFHNFSLILQGKAKELVAFQDQFEIFKKTNERCIEQINLNKSPDFNVKYLQQKEKQLESNNIELLIQNTRLNGFVDSLSKKIVGIEGTANQNLLNQEIEGLQQAIEDQQNKFNESYQIKEKQLTMLQATTGGLKAGNVKFERENSMLREAFQKHSSQIEVLTASNQQLTEQNINYKERLYMLQEDLFGHQEKYHEIKDLLKKFQTGYKKLQDKMDKISLDKTTNIHPPDKIDYEEEERFFETVRAIYKSNPLLTKRIKAEYVGLNTSNLEKKIASIDERPKTFQNQIYLDINTQDPNFNINHFRYYKFSFFTFVTQKYDSILKAEGNVSIYKSRKVTNIFLGTLRAILDCKWNEAVSSDSYSNFSDLSDFTWSWLSTFCIDNKTRKVTYNTEIAESDISIREQHAAYFYIDLMNPLLNKLWEIITFREFLNNETSSDEIYFYLHCRNMLFKGPELEYMEATFQPIHFIKYATAREVIEIIMSRYDQSNIEFMIGNIFKRCIKKNNNYLIDSSLVLRLLLEYYRAERIHRYRIIKELFFSQQGKDVKGYYSLPFEQFCKIFQVNYKGTTHLEQAQLYKECMTLGNGIVTPEIFFVVATEKNFFMKNLKIKMLSDIPEYDKNTMKIEPSYDYRAKMVTKFLEDCKTKLKGSLKNLKEYSIQMGVEQHYQQVNNLLSYVKDMSNMTLDSQQLAGKNLPLFFSKLISKVIQTAEMQMYHISQSEENIGETQIMEILFQRLENSVSFICDFIEGKKNKLEIAKHMRLKRFQIWIRKKISRWYNILNILLLAKLQEALKP